MRYVMKYSITMIQVSGIHKALVIDLDKTENRLVEIFIGQQENAVYDAAQAFIDALEKADVCH